MSAHPLYVLILGARVHGLVAVSDSNWIDIFACVKPRNLDIQFSFVVNVKPNCAWLPLAMMVMTRTNTRESEWLGCVGSCADFGEDIK